MEIEEHDLIEGRIGEMGTADAVSVDLRVPDDFMAQIKAQDDDPLFITAEVESGWSKSNRHWKPEHLAKTVKAVNDRRLGGVLGHPLLKDPKAYDADFPEPQVVWVKATMANKGSEAVARFKGYVLKSAKAREYLKLGLIDGVSIFGPSKMKRVAGGYDVIDFEPESIDFARKGRSGMPSRVLALAGEQATGTGGITVEPKDIAAISEEELRAHAPLLVREIERKVSEPFETKVGEQATLVAELQPQVDLLAKVKDLLKLSDGENPVEKLESLLTKVEEAGLAPVKEFISNMIDKKVKTPRVQALIRREIVGEMVTEYAGQELTADLKKKIEDDFTTRIEGDTDLKELVGEMAPFGESNSGSSNGGGSTMGGRSRAGSQRGRHEEEGVVRRSGGVVVRKQRIGA